MIDIGEAIVAMEIWLNCDSCERQWIAMLLPMRARAACRILKAHSECPHCGSPKVYWGKRPAATEPQPISSGVEPPDVAGGIP